MITINTWFPLKINPQKFWGVVNSKKTNVYGIADYIKYGDEIVESKEEAVKLFSLYWKKLYKLHGSKFTAVKKIRRFSLY